MTGVTVTRVPPHGDLDDALAVRRDVFVDEQGVPENVEYDGKDDEATHFVAYADDRAVGTARVRVVEPGVAKVERVAVRAADRECGVGTAVMERVESWAVDCDLDRLTLHAQTRVAEFYAALGYERSSGVFEEAGIDHVAMAKSLDQAS